MGPQPLVTGISPKEGPRMYISNFATLNSNLKVPFYICLNKK